MGPLNKDVSSFVQVYAEFQNLVKDFFDLGLLLAVLFPKVLAVLSLTYECLQSMAEEEPRGLG